MLVKRVLVALALVGASVVSSVAPSIAERSGAPASTEARDIARRFAAGDRFTCFLGGDGIVRCWGANDLGQIGNGDSSGVDVLAPTEVSGITNAVEIAAGGGTACALLADTTVKCWGNGSDGQLGNGTSALSRTPVHVLNSAGSAPLDGVGTIGVGVEHVCATRASDGAVYCWGDSIDGHLGNPSASGLVSLPIQVKADAAGTTNLTGIAELAVGSGSSCGLKSDGLAYCWGSNYYGQLATGANSDSRDYAISWGISGLVGIDVGGQHICGITTGSLVCAGGSNSGYVFGQMLQKTSLYPNPYSSLKQVATTSSATCVVESSGALTCAGSLLAGSTRNVWADGDGATGFLFTSASVSNVLALAAGTNHFCAYFSSSIKCWGSNSDGQLGGGSASSHQSFTSVATNVAGSVSLSDPGAKTVDSASFSVAATSNSGGVVTFSVSSGSAGVCSTTSSGAISILGAGDCVVNAALASSGIFSTATATRTITIAALQPVLGVATSSAVSFTSASVSTAVNPKGASATTRVEYSTASDLAQATTSVLSGSQTGLASENVETALSSLTPGTVYYFRFVATNSVGSTLGEIQSFTTRGARPTVTTGAAVATAEGATLSGEVNANDVDSTVSFDYGTDAALSNSMSAAVADATTGATVKSVSAVLSKLTPATTYYYRVVATNAVGTARGDIKSFTTKGSKPTAITGSATRSTAGMTLNGKVNANDLEASVQFEYGTDSKLVGAQKTAARTQTGATETDVSAAVIGLAEDTTYYYRIIASNAVGSVEGEIRSFTTTKAEGVSINDGEEFTSSQSVTVSVVGPSTAVKAILSNDGGFKTSETFDLVNNAAEIPWQLQSSREGTFTKIVYVKYVSRFGSQSTPYTDDIILDTTKPVVSTATAAAGAAASNAVTVSRVGVSAKKAAGGVRLSVRGSDTVSGIGTIEVRSAANKPAVKVKIAKVSGKADGKPRVASQTVSLKTTAKRLQVRVLDRAGNASAWRTIVVK